MPALLVALRFALGPVLFLDAADGATSPWFLVGLVVAFLSDIFDGVIARRLSLVSTRLREADGHTDVWFYAWVVASAWQSHQEAMIAAALPILLMVAAQLLSWLVDWLKYRQLCNYHAYSAKLWGITLFVATVALFGFDSGGVFFWVAAAAGVLCVTDEIAMTLTLDTWTCDVPSVFHARRLQAQARAAGLVADPR
ncbi:MAG: CDP-diacylglycerol--glycerol-3-phosphate 3-phosphatidyltransferase [Chloroflexales bacterium]|nr:CDP-diacylglycerol--glycerol-3-phosphate 3-phosphatidyltransferase [Chloroflexales bacterium]